MFNIEDIKNKIICGDVLGVLKEFPDNSIDTVITDPPYGLSNHPEKLIREVTLKWLSGEEDYTPKTKGFMGKSWDAFVPPPALWKEVYRVMKPGGTILCFAGSRTQDLMAISLRLAGFEIKDTIMWLYGQGFPKSTDISKQIDKKFGKQIENNAEFTEFSKQTDTTKHIKRFLKCKLCNKLLYGQDCCSCKWRKYRGQTPEAKQWEGYGTALKPSYEPIILAIKPNDGSYAENALKWGVAGLNIDGGRIETKEILNAEYGQPSGSGCYNWNKVKKKVEKVGRVNTKGRFPANTILSCECDEVIEGKHTNPECPCYMLDKQSGIRKSGYMSPLLHKRNKTKGKYQSPNGIYGIYNNTILLETYGDKGGASRFFYCAKASKSERNMGGVVNKHPTVKSLALLEYLVKLTSMPNPDQIYLDPFLGSGTTAMACEKLNKNWIGIEKEEEYCQLAQKRIEKLRKENNSLFQQNLTPPEIVY
jgi:site-specific DNA-methyltransferase (adenine-specific)